MNLLRNERSLMFFATIAMFLWIGAAILGLPLLQHWLETGLVPRVPTAILCSGSSSAA